MNRISILLTALFALTCTCAWAKGNFNEQLNAAYAAEDSGHYEHAIQILLPMLETVPKDSTDLLADVLSTLANDYYRLGQFDKALEYGKRNLALDEESGKEEKLSSSLNNLAAICSTIGRYEQAEEYLLRCIEIEERLGRDDKLAIRLGMLCEVYTLQERTEEALPLARRALELEQKAGREDKAAIRMSQLGNALVHLQRFQEAEPYLRQAVGLLVKHQNYSSLSLSLLALGQVDRNLGNPAKAEQTLKQSVHIAQQIGQRHTRMSAYRELARLYDEMRRPDQAYHYLDAYIQLKDSISTEQVHQQISELQVRYETARKELELANQKSINERQRIITWTVCFLLLLTVIALVAVLHSLLIKKRIIRLRDEFHRIISHDLKNPTKAIQDNLHLIYRYYGQLSQEEVHTQIGQLAEAADAQSMLLADLLTWSQLQTHRLVLNPIRMDLNSVVSDVLSQHAMQASTKGITLSFPTSSTPAFVFADRQTVSTILRNLISNAIKYSRQDGTIEVVTEHGQLCVTDHGCGMDPRLQTPQKGTAGETGTGIGLHLVRTLIKLNKGTFAVKSQVGEGTQITVTFPSSEA